MPSSMLGKLFQAINSIPRVCYRHKWKTLFVIFLFYAGRKVWRIYQTWVKPFMDVARQMKVEAPKPAANQENIAEVESDIDSNSNSDDDDFQDSEAVVLFPQNMQGEKKAQSKRAKKMNTYLYNIAAQSKDVVLQIKIF